MSFRSRSEGIVSGRETVGHRFLFENKTVSIDSPDSYAAQLRAAFVEPDPAVRRAQVIAQAHDLAESIGGKAVLPDALVDENVFLTEWVTDVLAASRRVLTLPRPVLETAMKKHQRFFPVEGPDAALLPALSRSAAAAMPICRLSAPAMRASLPPASTMLSSSMTMTGRRRSPRRPRARSVSSSRRSSGTLAAKTERLENLLSATGLLHWTGDAAAASRAAFLAKTDLATEIVMELPALQGVMGREFARMDGEPAAVSEALLEQYLPRTAGDALPQTPVGTALSSRIAWIRWSAICGFVGAEPKGIVGPVRLEACAGAIVDLLARDRNCPRCPFCWKPRRSLSRAGLDSRAQRGQLLALVEVRLRAFWRSWARGTISWMPCWRPRGIISPLCGRAEVLSTEVFTENGLATVAAATRVRNILRSVKEPIAADLPDVEYANNDGRKDPAHIPRHGYSGGRE
jgi:glycyl-tRNA synthetase beta chain